MIFEQVAPPIRAFLKQILADKNISRTVTYKVSLGADFDDDLGRTVAKWDDTTLRGARLSHNMKSVAASTSSEVEIGDTLFMFDATHTPAESVMSLKDRIVDEDGVRYKIKAMDHIFGIAVSVTVEGGR